jgi:hypothetical protein
MKAIKTVLVVILGCVAVALIAMVGTSLATPGSDMADQQAQTTMQPPEFLPAVAIDNVTLDRIFQ